MKVTTTGFLRRSLEGLADKIRPALKEAVEQSLEFDGATLFPKKTDFVHSACGLEWTGSDIARFLRHTGTVPTPSSPIGYCRIWRGAKSRGSGNRQWYGSFWLPGYNGKPGKSVRAHKFAAVAILGLRPGPGEHLDHACQNTLCVGCIRQMSKSENEALIRRPKKRHLDLAKELNLTPADIMSLEEHHPASLAVMERLIDAANQINGGEIPPGVIVTRPRRKRRKTRITPP